MKKYLLLSSALVFTAACRPPDVLYSSTTIEVLVANGNYAGSKLLMSPFALGLNIAWKNANVDSVEVASIEPMVPLPYTTSSSDAAMSVILSATIGGTKYGGIRCILLVGILHENPYTADLHLCRHPELVFVNRRFAFSTLPWLSLRSPTSSAAGKAASPSPPRQTPLGRLPTGRAPKPHPGGLPRSITGTSRRRVPFTRSGTTPRQSHSSSGRARPRKPFSSTTLSPKAFWNCIPISPW